MIYVEAAVVLFLTLLNGFLAMSEFSILSARRSRLKHLSSQGSRGARIALRLLEDPGRFLSTIQIGITLIGIVAGAFSGATLGQRLGIWLNTFSWFSPHGVTLGIGITVAVITYLSLILGELVPKRIALVHPEKIAAFAAVPIQVVSSVSAPLVALLKLSTERMLRLLGVSTLPKSTVTEEEIKSLIAEGTRSGVLMPQEQEMIEGVLRLADRPVQVIMTPRHQIVWLDSKASQNVILETIDAHRISRLLVCDGSIHHPVGVVHCKNLLPAALRGDDMVLSTLLNPVIFVPDHTPVLKLIELFKRNKTHLAVVVDEYGTTEGIVTPTDVLESIAGSLPEQGEEASDPLIQREDGSWLVDGSFPLDEIESKIGRIGVSSVKGAKTIAGFVLQRLGRLPEPGASFHSGNIRFEVVEMDGRRIDKVLIKKSSIPIANNGLKPDE